MVGFSLMLEAIRAKHRTAGNNRHALDGAIGECSSDRRPNDLPIWIGMTRTRIASPRIPSVQASQRCILQAPLAKLMRDRVRDRPWQIDTVDLILCKPPLFYDAHYLQSAHIVRNRAKCCLISFSPPKKILWMAC
jgi:hypothetical protein